MSFPWQADYHDCYLPMLNFDSVETGLYRSGFPLERNGSYVKKLGIRTMLCVEPKLEKSVNAKELESYWASQGIQFIYSPLDVMNYPSEPDEVNGCLEKSLLIILDRRNYPILINCLKGQHYTGILVACIRRLQQWTLHSIYMEFSHFEKKMHIYDMLIVEMFHVHLDVDYNYLPAWISKDQLAEVIEDIKQTNFV